MLPQQRMERFAEMLAPGGFFDIANAPATPPPTESLAAFHEVMGDLLRDGPAMRLVLHPWFRRWTVVFYGRNKHSGHCGWYPAMIFCKPPVAGVCPTDLRDASHYDVCCGVIGEYKQPDHRDFRDLREWADRQRWGSTKERAEKLQAEQIAFEEAKGKAVDTYASGVINYYKSAMERDVNQWHGSMQGLPFVPVTSKEAVEKEFPSHLLLPIYSEQGELLYHRKVRLSSLERRSEERRAILIRLQTAASAMDRVSYKAILREYQGLTGHEPGAQIDDIDSGNWREQVTNAPERPGLCYVGAAGLVLGER